MANNEIDIQIRAKYSGDDELNKLRADLQSIGTIKAFDELQQDIDETAKALDEAGKKAEDLKAVMDQSGAKVDTQAYQQAQKDVARLSETLQAQQVQLASYAASLKAAGISTLDLAAAQKALAASVAGKSNVMAAENILGVRSFATISGEIKNLEKAYATMAASGIRSDAEIARAHEALLIKTKALNMEMASGPNLWAKASSGMASSMTSGLMGIGAAMAGVFAVDKLVEYLGKMREVSEEHVQINARLRLMSASEKDLHDTESQLFAISQKTGTAYATNADIFARMGIILISAGVSSKSLISAMDVLNQTLVVSGANTEKSASFMGSFVTAMDLGTIKAKQLKSMMADNPEFVKLLAQSLNVTIEGLIQLAESGELTRDRVLKATADMAGQAGKDFATMPISMQRAMTEMKNAINQIIGDSKDGAKGTSKISEAIIELARTIEANRSTIDGFLAGLISGTGYGLSALLKLNKEVFSVSENFGRMTELYGLTMQKIAVSMVGGDTSGIQKQIDWNKNYFDAMAKAGEAAHKRIFIAAGDSANKQRTTYAPVTKEIEDQYRKMAENVKSIMQQISDNNFDIAKAIGDVQRSGMSAGDAWLSLRAEADQYAKAAQAAAAAGNFAEADRNMKAALTDAKSLSNEVTVNGERMTARNAKIAELNKLGRIQTGILEEQAAAEKQKAAALDATTGGELSKKLPDIGGQLGAFDQQMNTVNQKLQQVGDTFTNVFKTAADDIANVKSNAVDLGTTYEELQKRVAAAMTLAGGDPGKATELVKQQYIALAEYMKNAPLPIVDSAAIDKNIIEIQRVEAQQKRLAEGSGTYKISWKDAFGEFLNTGTSAADVVSKALDEMSKDRTVTIHIREQRDSGGGSDGEGYHRGGSIGAQLMAEGGSVLRNMLSGGYFPGFGGGDRRHVVAEDGEYMFDKHRVRDVGLPVIRAFHAGNYGFVIRELMKKAWAETSSIAAGHFDLSNVLRRKVGGIINNMPSMPRISSPFMADGGAVTSLPGGGGGDVYHLTTNFHGNQTPMSQEISDRNARQMIASLERMNRRRS